MTLLLTPKALAKMSKESKDLILQKYPEIKIEPTTMVYINMMDGWTSDECDEVVYIVDETEFKKNLTFTIP